jgi:predicted phage gp36 major capsid-like protein
MQADFGVIIGLIGAVSVAGILGLSYLGAYFVGYNRARRELDREQREDAREARDEARTGHAERILVVESALDSIAQALERLTDAQRLVLLEQARAASSPERRSDPARIRQHNTPA